jgi:hypothetical protein
MNAERVCAAGSGLIRRAGAGTPISTPMIGS